MLIIGIAGGTGSGKTTVVRKIIQMTPASCHLGITISLEGSVVFYNIMKLHS